MAELNKLSAQQVKNAKKPVGDGGGLWLKVQPGNRKSWAYRYRLAGKDHEMGLGAYPAVTLSQARKLAKDARDLKSEGKDPLEQRRNDDAARRLANSRALTFSQCAIAYMDSKKVEWKNPKHRQQWENTLQTYAYPVIGKTSVSNITREDVLRTLEPIWHTKTETASRVRQRIERVIDYAIARQYREAENPARWKGHLKELLPAPAKIVSVKHMEAMPHQAIGAFMAKLRAVDATSASALEFTILTVSRTGSAIGARWDEIDLKARIWTIPADRMKTKQEFVVPLSPAALALIKRLPKIDDSPYLFPGMRKGKSLSNMAMLKLLKTTLGQESLTVHGFRSTFRDWAAEQTTYPREVIETAMAHKLRDKVEAAYLRSNILEKRRNLLNEWAKFLSLTRSKGNVVAIRRGS